MGCYEHEAWREMDETPRPREGEQQGETQRTTRRRPSKCCLSAVDSKPRHTVKGDGAREEQAVH